MKSWRLLFIPEQKHRRTRHNKQERYRQAVEARQAWLSVGLSVPIIGLMIYLATTAARVGSPKDMVRAQLVRDQHIEPTRTAAHGSDSAPAADALRARLGSTATNRLVDEHLPSVEGRFAPLGFDRLGGFPINVTQLIYQSHDSSGQRSEVNEQIPEPIKKCDGQLVSVRGFMLPQKFDKGLVTEFLLLKSQALCCYGAISRINEWIIVDTAKGTRAVMDQPLTIRGRLHVGEIREDGLLTGIYKMEADP